MHGVAGTDEAVVAGGHVLRAGDDRDPPPARGEQVLDGEPPAGPVVGIDDAPRVLGGRAPATALRGKPVGAEPWQV